MTAALKQTFPNLEAEGYEETSPATAKYNCVAWAAGLSSQWWWPDPSGAYPWPEGVPRTVTIDAFLGAFATLSYHLCAAEDCEPGFEKVAIYCLDGKPTHAARQLPDGRWTSKLGKYIDIVHSLRGLEGTVYGKPTHFMKRVMEKE